MKADNMGVNMISVNRNSYREDYGRGRNTGRQNVSQSRGGFGGRGQDSLHARAARYGAQGISAPGSRRIRSVRKRQRRQIQCIAILLGLVTLAVLGVGLLVRNSRAAAAGSVQNISSGTAGTGSADGSLISGSVPQAPANPQPSGTVVQGLPEEVFAKHPEWEENFLTPNEYSRPGDELKEVKNIFVHYTANPGTSAAQNRSYFERQKDEHLASVSSHFIIGYDGEIIQCVPLTEIAYAVMTRNFDSVSIECCYKAKDGSFTKETYDSLISLLAWLTDAYGLDTEDILRHYDCGGKKCPLYYTDHEDKWEVLKADVDELRGK